MGKSKKTRWRTFSFNGSKEDETHIIDGKLNDSDTKYSASETPHKYSQILGDHQTNYISSSINNRTTTSSSIHNSKTRNGYNNNKENYYNQRSAAKNTLSSKATFGSQRSHKFPINASSLKDNNKKPDNGSSENVSKVETVKFNEDEYTRITTPRQDVLFKKGYLSRMNNNNNNNNSYNNKTVSPTTVSTDSTAPNSSITTNSDQESNVSTLSPATTPSMEYGQVDGMEYAAAAPLYYPGYYYDENGILVIPAMYNGYNYYSNGSSATSPVYLMPYPYQYDPFFMAPNTEVPNLDAPSTEKSEQQQEEENGESNEKSEDVKATNNPTAEEQNGARMPSEDATTNSSSQREETESDEKSVKQEQTENTQNEQSSKQTFSFYPNEFGYMYPTYSNGFYNGLYYYSNGMPSNRPSKLRRRRRFLSARNSHPRSTETTTDYSDDDVVVGHTAYTSNYRRYNPRHHNNGWMYHNNNHHHHYNQYHYNSKYNKVNVDKNANETPSNLNVDVPEFYPCVQTKSEDEEAKKQEQESKRDMPTVNNDLQNNVTTTKTKCEMPIKINGKASHTSKLSSTRPLSKKDIIEGIKSMEQQNINLISTSKIQINNSTAKGDDDEWNVIKNGKKIKILKDTDDNIIKGNSEEVAVNNIENSITPQKATIVEEIKPNVSLEKSKKTIQTTSQFQKSVTPQTTNSQKSKKSKGKNKKKKNNHFTGKQDGFEIIEPEFGNNSDDSTNRKGEDLTNETTEEDAEEIIDDIIISNDNDECKEISNVEIVTNNVTACDEQLDVVNLESVDEAKEEEIILKVLNVQAASNVHENDDAVIDISDEDICSRTSIEIDLSIAQEIAAEIEKKVEVSATDSTEVEKNENGEDVFNDINFFDNNHKNIAELERDLMENLKILDDGIDIKSPIINPLYDFPITSAVQKWLHDKQNESFDNLFRIENFKKLSELYDDCENDVDDDKSDISDSSPFKSDTTDSDYASDIQVNKGSPASSNAKITSKCNNKMIVKESFCALM